MTESKPNHTQAAEALLMVGDVARANVHAQLAIAQQLADIAEHLATVAFMSKY